jgi:hypothetical protein
VRGNSEAKEVALAKESRGDLNVFGIASVAEFGRMERLIF